MSRIASVLNLPERFFTRAARPLALSPVFYRSLAAATKGARSRAERKIQWVAEELLPYLSKYVELPTPNIPRLDLPPDVETVPLADIEDLAAEVTQVRVVDGEGLSMTEGKPSTEGPTVTQALATTLHPGSYVVTYKVISADGHPVSGAVPFTVAEDAVTAPTQPESAPGPTANGAPSSSTAPAATTSPATVAAPATTASDDGSADRDGGINGWLLGLALAGVAVAFGVLGWRYRAQR